MEAANSGYCRLELEMSRSGGTLLQERRRRNAMKSKTATSIEPEIERKWVLQAQTGDSTAFRWLYDRHLDRATHQVGRIMGPGADIEDVVQDVFVQVFRSIGNYRFESKFSTWLYRVTYNVTISHLRKQPKTVELADWRPLRDNVSTWSRLEARDLVRVLYAALEHVQPEAREAFLMHEVEGMKLREIAELTGDSLNTISARVRRTREKLQAVLESAQTENV